ncbi:hypothetical protein NUU61_009481 [Penicillium alfredii]|uniref:C2H2-type domain-containing protein n=1 Tax=Penicillium alfredii TaxID=1506179 RepID=A0A9W9JXQ6_9EURO|nr:uncharacterized protein NUU61_009481 [Penicillium alfredii]KAJ5084902.1 hypothetical protein NUU61_009481 [Penicillium alfredii]
MTTRSRRKVATMENNFKRWTEQLDPPDWRFWILEKFSLRLIEGFLRWYLNTHNVVRKSAFQTLARYFSMFCNQERSQEAPYEFKQKLKRLVNGTLSDQYEIELSAHEQPPFNIDDLLFTTYHLLVWCPITFPTVRSIFQLNTLRKMMTSTSARPGTLIESSGYLHENDALKWKDIELFMVKHPENPTSQMLLMRVRHRLNKGRRNEGVPPVYTYTERNDNLGLCVIQDILMYAFLDNAFDSQHIKCPRDIWRLTVIPEHRLNTPINFKESVKETPILRGASRNQAGLLVTDPQRALQYNQARQWEAAARHLDEHSRNRIMGHTQGKTFANYISVMDDTQSIFMETPARKSLLSLATHASITRDPSAPQCPSPAQKDSVELDTKTIEWKNECKTLRTDLIIEYGQLKTAKESGDKRSGELQKLQNKIKSRRKKLCDSAKSNARADFFRQVGNRIIESNHLGEQIKFTSDTGRIQPERITLANLEFQNRDADKIDDDELTQNRIRSLELRLELHRLHVPSGLKAHIRFNETTSKVTSRKESEDIKPKQILQCPVCLGRAELHPAAREFCYARKDALQRHFKTHELPMFFDKPGRVCDIPGCIYFSVSLPGYQSHLAQCHSIFL